MARHFDASNNNIASYFVIKQAVKLDGFTSKQYWQTTPLRKKKAMKDKRKYHDVVGGSLP